MLSWFVYFVVRDFEINYMIMLACLFVSLIVLGMDLMVMGIRNGVRLTWHYLFVMMLGVLKWIE